MSLDESLRKLVTGAAADGVNTAMESAVNVLEDACSNANALTLPGLVVAEAMIKELARLMAERFPR